VVPVPETPEGRSALASGTAPQQYLQYLLRVGAICIDAH